MNFLHSVREFVTPVLKTSHFYEVIAAIVLSVLLGCRGWFFGFYPSALFFVPQKGVLTPEEFVAAGDRLVFQCSTWEW